MNQRFLMLPLVTIIKSVPSKLGTEWTLPEPVTQLNRTTFARFLSNWSLNTAHSKLELPGIF